MIRTRFAPSPTGYLHVGGARTALFSWLYARKKKGIFILRVEDTDLERSTEAAVQVILDGMQWLGLDHDEGPFYQTARFDRYKEIIGQLLNSGHAYYCSCSKERLENLRAEQMRTKQKPRYDGHCRDSRLTPAAGESYAVRFRNPAEGEVVVDDQIHGRVVFSNGELDDLIIARSDGVPTYNLSVVVDDMDMQISHVIRGDDHLNNTPRQINIFRALGMMPPHYAHVPMILGEDNKRLSKRHGAVNVLQYQQEGYLPEALLNYLIRLGWSHGDQEIFSRQEMIELFEISDINKAASAINPGKLLWLNQHYLKTLDPQQIAGPLAGVFKARGVDPSRGPALPELIKVQRDRCKTLVEMLETSLYFYLDVSSYDDKAAEKHFNAAAVPVLQHLAATFAEIDTWQSPILHDAVKKSAEELGMPLGQIAPPLRLALTGGTVSPSIDKTLYLLGQGQAIMRTRAAIEYIKNRFS